MERCQVCKKQSDDVRFAGSWEGFICDTCLDKVKEDRKDNNVLSGCGSVDNTEIDGQEFEVETLKDFIDVLKTYKNIHLNFMGDENIDMWVSKNE